MTKVEFLRQRESEGKSLLQMKPIDRNAYLAWSDALRETVGGALGGSSSLFKELFLARRTISVAFESDPSYYLTQLGANLRRELAVLRKCIEELGVTEGVSQAPASRPPSSAQVDTAAPARPSVPSPPLASPRKGPSIATKEQRPAESAGSPAQSLPAASARGPRAGKVEARILVVPAGDDKASRMVLAALAGWNASELKDFDDLGELHRLLSEAREAASAVVVVAPTTLAREGGDGNGSDGAAPCLDVLTAFKLGFMAGALGPERICVVHAEGAELPLARDDIFHVSIQDPDGWRPKVVKRLRDAGVPLRE